MMKKTHLEGGVYVEDDAGTRQASARRLQSRAPEAFGYADSPAGASVSRDVPWVGTSTTCSRTRMRRSRASGLATRSERDDRVGGAQVCRCLVASLVLVQVQVPAALGFLAAAPKALSSRAPVGGLRGGCSGVTMTAVPSLCVFDLDACLWDQEMFQMGQMPGKTVLGDLNGRGEGVIGVYSGMDKISLHKGALVALQEHYDKTYPGMKIAVASSADTPQAVKIGRAALKMLEVVPGTTVWDLLVGDWEGKDINQIGRSPPLSSDKSATHFPFLKQASGVPYDRMLFFDDCNWGDHCGKVSSRCLEDSGRGVVAVRTPSGLREADWRKGIAAFAAAQSGGPRCV